MGKKKNKYKNPRDEFEMWLDRHNHKLELIRTIGSVLAGLAGMVAILRVLAII